MNNEAASCLADFSLRARLEAVAVGFALPGGHRCTDDAITLACDLLAEDLLPAAMREAIEQPQAGLMDTIRKRHQRHLRRVVLGCVTLTATAMMAKASWQARRDITSPTGVHSTPRASCHGPLECRGD